MQRILVAVVLALAGCSGDGSEQPGADIGSMPFDLLPLPDLMAVPDLAFCLNGLTTCGSTEICTIDTESDPANCGGCGIVCSGGGGMQAFCARGQCMFRPCGDQFRNCDGDPRTFCETYIGADNNNCGGCGIVCPKGTACSNHACVPCVESCEGHLWEVCCRDVMWQPGQTAACANDFVVAQNNCYPCGVLGQACCPGAHCVAGMCRMNVCQ